MNEKNKLYEKGSSTIYFAILSAAFISAFALIMSSMLRMQQTNEVMRQASLASDMIMSYYDSSLESQYGLLAYQNDEAIFKSAMEPYFGSDYKVEVLETLSNLKAFQNQAVMLGQLALAKEVFKQLETQNNKQQELDERQDFQRDVKMKEQESSSALSNREEWVSLADEDIKEEDSDAVKAQKQAAKSMSQEDQKKAKELFLRLKNRPKTLNDRGEESVENQDSIDPKLYSRRYLFDQQTATDLTSLDQLCFRAYLLTNFNHRLKASPQTEFKHVFEKGELEYLLSGSSQTRTNYFNVYAKLFAIREGVNLMHLSRSPEKMKIVTEASLLVSSLFPIAQPLTQVGFLSLWATAESAEDLKALLRGDSISLLKLRESEWQTDFDGKLTGSGAKAPGENSELKRLEWIDYKGCLGLLLSVERDQTLALRAMTLIDLNFQQTYKKSISWADMVVSHRVIVRRSTGKEVEFETSYLSQLAD